MQYYWIYTISAFGQSITKRNAIITYCGYSLAIASRNNRFLLFNSHCCGLDGLPAVSGEGTAALRIFSNRHDFVETILSVLNGYRAGVTNMDLLQCTIHFIYFRKLNHKSL